MLPPPTCSELMRSEETCLTKYLIFSLNKINVNPLFQLLSIFIFSFRFEAENAENDVNAPSFCFGRIRGYLAFDTGKNTHYYWYLYLT